MPATGSTYSKASLATRIQIWERLQSICHKLPDHPGLCQYDAGYSDEEVAKQLNNGVTKSMVTGVRREMLGELHRTRPTDNAALDRRLHEVEGELRRLGEAFLKLKESLGA